MRDFYTRVDAAIAAQGLQCKGCGECCRFDVVDHILYASELEREYLREVAELPKRPDRDASLVDLLKNGKRCPYQTNNRCEARNARTLGCRLHFCDWANSPEEMDFAEKRHNELKALHSALGAEWDYRPLLPLE